MPGPKGTPKPLSGNRRLLLAGLAGGALALGAGATWLVSGALFPSQSEGPISADTENGDTLETMVRAGAIPATIPRDGRVRAYWNPVPPVREGWFLVTGASSAEIDRFLSTLRPIQGRHLALRRLAPPSFWDSFGTTALREGMIVRQADPNEAILWRVEADRQYRIRGQLMVARPRLSDPSGPDSTSQ
ncbi:MAG: hypothetical protein AAF675_06720 [Pseudomonadota bacterium]